MTQTKTKRRRTPKPALTAEEFALCERAINEYDDVIERKFARGRIGEGRADFLSWKLAEWYAMPLNRGGVSE